MWLKEGRLRKKTSDFLLLKDMMIVERGDCGSSTRGKGKNRRLSQRRTSGLHHQ